MRQSVRQVSHTALSEYSRPSVRLSPRVLRAGMAVFATVSLITLAACGGNKDTALGSDTALGRDLAMAATDTNAQPKLEDVPVTPPPTPAPVAVAPAPTPRPAPARPRPTTTPTTPRPTTPAATPAPAKPSTGSIDAGSTVRFAANTKVCSNTTKVGDRFTAPVSQSVAGSNGASIPAGAMGTFEVIESKTAKNSNDNTTLKVRLVSITIDGESYPVTTTLQTASTERVRSATKGTDAKKVAGGAVIGAIAGQIIGKSTKGTVIGAAAGAAAGTAAASATADYDTCLNSGAEITVTLDSPITVKIAAE
jgi:uncharacterized protein YcfJ